MEPEQTENLYGESAHDSFEAQEELKPSASSSTMSPKSVADPALLKTYENAQKIFTTLFDEIGKVIVGHLLESNPGLGKTLTISTISKVVDLSFNRIQCTPDLMPADITGTTIVEEKGGSKQFRFEHGPIFANIILADEINRASPKTQSALLEAMQEKQVTVAGHTYPLDKPFFVSESD